MRPFISLLFYLLLMEDVVWGDKTYCNPRKSLITDLVVPTYEETRPVKGCVGRVTSIAKQVVVIRAKATQTLPQSEILLTLTDPKTADDGGVLLVLDSPSPLTWKLSFLPKTDNFQVVLSPGSILGGGSDGAEVLKYKNLDPEMTDEKFGTLVEQNYGPVSLMAMVENANRISLSLSASPSTSSISSKCNFDSLGTIPDSAVAFRVEKQKMYGCYHAERAGSMTTDLLVIDLNFKTYDHDSNIQPVVFLSMTPMQSQDGSSVLDPSPRNLTLVLNSNGQVRWYLESWKMHGTLQVISSNGLVENHALSPEQSLQIIRKRLPEDYGQLWRSVIAETGVAPISYVKVNDANVISLLIPPRAGKTVTTQKMTSNYAPDRVSLHDSPIAGHEDIAINMQVPKKTNLDDDISRQMSKFHLILKPLYF